MDCFLFSKLNETDKATVLRLMGEPIRVPKNGELYKVGFVGILLSGCATVCRTGDTGNAVTVRGIHAGEAFGAASVFGEWNEGKSNIVARSDCSVVYASEETLKGIFEKYPTVAVNYISFLSDRIRFLNRRIDAFSAGSAVQKLYEYLVSQAKDGVVTLDFGLAELSRRLKMGRSSLYRSLEFLEQNELLERDKHTFTLK